MVNWYSTLLHLLLLPIVCLLDIFVLLWMVVSHTFISDYSLFRWYLIRGVPSLLSTLHLFLSIFVSWCRYLLVDYALLFTTNYSFLAEYFNFISLFILIIGGRYSDSLPYFDARHFVGVSYEKIKLWKAKYSNLQS